jgi:hypothetical protein
MYWWNVSKLAEDLREGRVDEKERFKYFLAAFVSWTVSIQILLYSGGGFSTEGLVCAAANLTAAIIGTIVCHRINASGDNRDFLTRMICLSGRMAISLVLAVSIWFSVLSLIHSLFDEWHGIVSLILTSAHNFREPWIRVPTIFWVVVYYLAICWHLAYIAQAKEVQDVFHVFHIIESDLSLGEVVLILFGFAGLVIIPHEVHSYVSRFVGHGELAGLLAFLAVGLWVLMVGFVLVWMRRRSTKQTSCANHMNQ